MHEKVEEAKIILERIFLMPVTIGDANEVLMRIEALQDRAAELLRVPAQPEQTCPSCNGEGYTRENGHIVWCEPCYGTGKSERSGGG